MRDLITLVEKAHSPRELSPEFLQWFSGSKVVDDEGKPLVCYHGTFREFIKFEYNDNGWAGSGFNRLGFWFDVHPDTPNYFAGFEQGAGPSNGGNVRPCYLSIKKPLVIHGDMIWGEDITELLRLRDVVKTAKPNTEEQHLARKAEDALYKQLMKDDGFYRMLQLLPNGAKSTTEEVAAFQQEIISEGYDGIHLVQTLADFGSRGYQPTDWWLAFTPEQIRSALTLTETVLVENEITPSQMVQKVLDDWLEEAAANGHPTTPYNISHGGCFEFSQALEDAYPEVFQAVDIGGIFRYGGQYEDEPEGFDEELISKHWKNYKPYEGLTWNQMFHDVGLNWPGTHAWGYCEQTGLCYDSECVEGIANPFDLPFFKPWLAEFKKRLTQIENTERTEP